MKKEVLVKPKDKDFFEFLKEKLEGKVAWVYIDKATIKSLGDIGGIPYVDTNSKLHILCGDIVVDAYKDNYDWYRISSVKVISYKAPTDPDEILFVTMKD